MHAAFSASLLTLEPTEALIICRIPFVLKSWFDLQTVLTSSKIVCVFLNLNNTTVKGTQPSVNIQLLPVPGSLPAYVDEQSDTT